MAKATLFFVDAIHTKDEGEAIEHRAQKRNYINCILYFIDYDNV